MYIKKGTACICCELLDISQINKFPFLFRKALSFLHGIRASKAHQWRPTLLQILKHHQQILCFQRILQLLQITYQIRLLQWMIKIPILQALTTFHLPPSDNSVVLVSQPLTGPENYLSWSRAVFLSLSGRNKFGFLNGQISMPDPSSSLYNTWYRSNTTILSWLVNSLSKELQSSVMYIHTARDLWIDMHDRFS